MTALWTALILLALIVVFQGWRNHLLTQDVKALRRRVEALQDQVDGELEGTTVALEELADFARRRRVEPPVQRPVLRLLKGSLAAVTLAGLWSAFKELVRGTPTTAAALAVTSVAVVTYGAIVMLPHHSGPEQVVSAPSVEAPPRPWRPRMPVAVAGDGSSVPSLTPTPSVSVTSAASMSLSRRPLPTPTGPATTATVTTATGVVTTTSVTVTTSVPVPVTSSPSKPVIPPVPVTTPPHGQICVWAIVVKVCLG